MFSCEKSRAHCTGNKSKNDNIYNFSKIITSNVVICKKIPDTYIRYLLPLPFISADISFGVMYSHLT